ncbi:MAG: UDP-N-acetylmuramoyl-tripeptide--D-alanyl-D-alanine ligase [Aeromonas sp.]
MLSLTLQELALALDARLVGEDVTLSCVTTDTRALGAGALFVALKGENFDGHDFCQAALAAGAVALLVERELPLALPQLVVADSLKALGLIGLLLRERVNPKVLAITGSCGKTTVKEMACAILQCTAQRSGLGDDAVLATAGNFNNEVGVPLTLLRLTPAHQFAVLELGANHPGEIAWTTGLAKPDAAIINNVAAAHLEGFGSLEGVFQAKSEIFLGLPKGGAAIVNGDSEFWPAWQAYGVRDAFAIDNPAMPYHARQVQIKANGCAEFTLCAPQGEVLVSLVLPGRHNVANALAAAAGCLALGATLADVQAGLALMAPVKGRFCLHQLGHIALVDDTYNASVESVLAGIDALCLMAGKKVLVFGDMRELGESSAAQHARVGAHAKACGLDRVLCVGPESKHTAQAAAGEHFADKVALFGALSVDLQAGTPLAILVKGSRGSKMEELVEMVIRAQESASC